MERAAGNGNSCHAASKPALTRWTETAIYVTAGWSRPVTESAATSQVTDFKGDRMTAAVTEVKGNVSLGGYLFVTGLKAAQTVNPRGSDAMLL